MDAIELRTLGDGDRPGAVTVRSLKGRRFGASLFWAAGTEARKPSGPGCASTYQLSEKTKQELATMNREKALATIQRGLVANDRQCGIYGEGHTEGALAATVGFVNPRSVSMSGTVIHYTGELRVYAGSNVSGNVGGGTGAVTTTFGTQALQLAEDLTQVRKILLNSATFGQGSSCGPHTPGIEVKLIVSQALSHVQWLSFSVAPESLDQFMAAAKTLAPSAIVEQRGF